MIQVEFHYVWYEMAENGLLGLPKDVGPHYDQVNVNRNDEYGFGFQSEEAAVAAYAKFANAGSYVANELVLIKKHCLVR